MRPTVVGAPVCPINVTVTAPLRLTPTVDPAGAASFTFDGPPGLYQFSVVMDAGDFDWEQLYEILNKYGNTNERTGPWDFSINHGAIPLVPSYWVSVNGERRGLWYFERVSLEDLAARRFRGKCAFYAAGQTTVTLTPYQPANPEPGQKQYDWRGLRWQSALLEVDPEDQLAALPPTMGDYHVAPAAAWAREDFWAAGRQALATTHALYQGPLQCSFDWVLARPERDPNDFLLLLMAHYLGERAGALEGALNLVDKLVAQPHWGNRNPEGYGHDGDMGAMYCLRTLAWAWLALGPQMGAERQARVLEKLRLQGERFFHLVLLHRDYWGGSLIQDHGRKSLFGFGIVALSLRGAFPEAERWARYVVPRLQRSLEAMPRDGVVPGSSHYHAYLYLDEFTHYREAFVAATGREFFPEDVVRPIVGYLANVLHEPSSALLSSPSDRQEFSGANHFLNTVAALYRDREAAYLQARLLEHRQENFYHTTQQYAHYLGAAYGFLTYDPTVPVADRLHPPTLKWYRDSGLVHYRDETADVTLALRCGPYSGYNAYRHAATCGCDRLGIAPGEGHFTLLRRGTPLLCSPDAGYSLRSETRSVLLIGGHGQQGDIGYPMSIAAYRDPGAQVLKADWDADRGRGWVRLWLQPAYAPDLGLAQYYRDFLLASGRLVIRDQVVLDAPQHLCWLFQGKREFGVSLEEPLTAVFGGAEPFRLAPEANEVALTAALGETHVVWSYASGSGFLPFDHVRYETTAPVTRAVADFVFTWS